MTAEQRLALIEVKIKRAGKHFADLSSEVQTFFGSNPYAVGGKSDVQTRKLIYCIVDIKPVPALISAIAGDALQNLRSALDHLIWQLHKVNGTNGTESHFPTGNSEATYKATLHKAKKYFRKDAMDLLYEVEAYKGGKGEFLWKLNRLNNIDKHRLLITVGSSFQSVNMGAAIHAMLKRDAEADGRSFDFPVFNAFFKESDGLYPLKIGDELVIDGLPNAEYNDKMQFAFNISLNEAGIVEGKPLLETIHQIADIVCNTIRLFKPCLQ